MHTDRASAALFFCFEMAKREEIFFIVSNANDIILSAARKCKIFAMLKPSFAESSMR
jgi:hypothetical protein